MIEFIDETGSTNADLAARLRDGHAVAEGDWLVAARQTAGRGRMGRSWFDGAGNFMGSTVVHLVPGDPPAPSLALVAGLSLHAVLGAYLSASHRAELKWPNDVMVGPAKLAGILLEREADAVIVGIGANLAHAPDLPDRPAVALAAFGTAPASADFAKRLAASFAQDVQSWRTYGLGPIIARWQDAAHPPGTRLFIENAGGGRIEGRFAGLAEDGALQLHLADGSLSVIHAGEVRYAPAAGD